MANLNRATILGNLGADPDVRFTPGGKAVATLSVATNESWKDDKGVQHERVEWHRVVVWGVQAENCGKYLAKGRQVMIEGRLTTRKWEDKDKITRYSTEIVAQNVIFLGKPEGNGARPPAPGDDDAPFGRASAGSPPPAEAGDPGAGSDDRIPF